MSFGLIVQVILSVALSSSAQLMLKAGMSSPKIQLALGPGQGLEKLGLAVATSPFVIAGLVMFGLSVVVWLAVLSKIEVSQAYPAIALGIVVTTVGGHFLFSEQLSVMRIVGLAVIVLGVALVARS